jgi:hypothetical protein
MSAYNDKRRDIKRAYRKKAFQSDMSLVRNTVEDRPLPEHSYSTPSHEQTSPIRQGIDPHTYITDVRPAVEHLDFARMVDSARFPWHLAPKGDSANVISREAYDFSATGNDIADNEYMDVLVLNVTNISGSNTSAPASSSGAPAPRPASLQVNTADGTRTGTGNPAHPNKGGNSFAGLSGTVTLGSPGEVYRISSFGHSEVSQANQGTGGGFTSTDPLRYQIWVDGSLFMEWQNFQWSPVTPLQSQWHFTQPITVTEQIVLRIINETGQTLDVGEIEACFNGWSEQLSGYVDVAYQQLENN